MRGWSRRRWTAVIVGALVGFWLVVVAYLAVAATANLAGGGEELRSVRAQDTVDELLAPETTDGLEAATDRFSAAHNQLSNPLMVPVGWIPVVGRHVRAMDRLAESGKDGSVAAIETLEELDVLVDQPRGAGPERIALLEDLEALAGRLRDRLNSLAPGSPDGLIGPLGNAIIEVDEQRAQADEAAARLEAASGGLAELFAGPSSYLLLGANNAEMRAGSGMFLSAAELRFADGTAQLGEVRPTADLILPAGTVTAAGDLQANWGWLDPGRDLRQLAVSADFPQSAQTAVATWDALEGTAPVEGVIAIDIDGLRSLLRAVGPVEADGVVYTADTIRGQLLRKQYEDFANRQDRRDQIGEVAKVIFERIESGDWELSKMVTELQAAVAGRHLMIWSADDPLRSVWDDTSADGHLEADSLAISLLNRSANKLDSWVDTRADVETAPRGDGRTDLTITYRIDNRSTGQGPRYVVGPGADGLAAGDYRGLVVANLPAGSSEVSIDGARPFLEGGDGPTVVIGGEITVPASTQATVTVRATLPEELDELTLEPAARIPRTLWRVDGTSYERDRRQRAPIG